MALKGVKLIACGFIFCFFRLGATFCTVDSDCEMGESCCSNNVCRKTCFNCHSDSDCGRDEVCCDGGYCCHCLSGCSSTPPWTLSTLAPITYYSFDSDCDTDKECCDGDCLSVCPSTWTGGSIAGAVVGTIVVFAIIISIVACFFCACCPYYRYRSPGTVVVTEPAAHQPFLSTTMTMSVQQIQHYPPPANCNQPPPPGYDQAPPPYPSYPQQPAQYPPSVPPPVGPSEPVNY